MQPRILFKKLGDKSSLIFTADVGGDDVTFGYIEGTEQYPRIVSTNESSCKQVMDTLNDLNIQPSDITPENIEQVLVDNKLMLLH